MNPQKHLFYNWNGKKNIKRKIELHDETLRDGLQAAYVRNPNLEQKIALLRLMEELGIDSANVGFPGASSRHEEDVTELAKYKKEHKMKIKLTCASRTLIDDLIPIVRAQENSGVQFEAGVFLESSEIRKLVEKWSLRDMGKMVRESVRFAVKNGLSVMFVTEDTTRARPEALKYLYSTAIAEGATRICIADTVGFATPGGVEKLVRFVIEKIVNGQAVKVDWHGHRDRNIEIANCFAAIEAGVNRVHGTALGVGERAGNVPIDLLMVNLKVEGLIRNNLIKLPEYAKFASIILDIPIPVNYPVLGNQAYTTGSGVHAAAQLKAKELGRDDLVVQVYSGVDPRIVGRMPEVEVGPMSGKANVILKLQELGVKPTSKIIKSVLEAAKSANNILSEEEIKVVINGIKEKKLLTDHFSIEEITFADYTILACAIQFNIFDHIENGRNTERMLSRLIPKNIFKPLIASLIAAGYLKQNSSGTIALSPISKSYLSSKAKTNLVPFFSNFEWYLIPIIAPSFLKNGRRISLRNETFNAITDISYELSKRILPVLEREAKEIFQDTVEVLDLGCGKMGMMIEAATRNERLKVLGVEQNMQTIKYLEKELQKRNLSKRVNVLQANIENLSNLNKNFDFILLSHVIHWIKERNLGKVLKFCRYHLKETGKLIIIEDYLEDSGVTPKESVRKNLILSFLGYKIFSVGEVYSALRKVGFLKIKSEVVDRRRIFIQAVR